MRSNTFIILFLVGFAAVKCQNGDNTCQDNNKSCGTNDDCCTENCVKKICTAPKKSCRIPGAGCGFNYHCCSFSCTSTIAVPFGQCLHCIKLTKSCSDSRKCCSHYCNLSTGVCETRPGHSSEEEEE